MIFSIAKDVNRSDVKSCFDLLKAMYLCRFTDDKMSKLVKQNKGGSFYLCTNGHEMIGAMSGLCLVPKKDWGFPYYRDRAFAIGLGSSLVDQFASFLARKGEHHSGGRMMPEHFSDRNLRLPCQSSCVGSQFLQAVGVAKAVQLNGRDEVVYVSGGDGATSQGDFHEALNFACLHQLGIIFVIQDNGWAISVPLHEQTAGSSIAKRALGYEGLTIFDIDGCNFEEVSLALKQAVEKARSKKGPSLIVAKVPRMGAHSSSDDPKKYKSEECIAQDLAKDPIPRFENWLQEMGLASENELEAFRREALAIVEKAAEEAEKVAFPDPNAPRAMFKTLPHDENLYRNNLKNREFSQEASQNSCAERVTIAQGQGASERVNFETKPTPLKTDSSGCFGITKKEEIETDGAVVMVDALNHALIEEMERDPKVVVFGQDVAHGKGGVFGITRGLTAKFGEKRCFNTPLAESTIIGLALGISLVEGFKPVAEIQFADYLWTGINQLFNELSSFYFRSDEEWNCPVVIRMPCGGYIQGGPYHSQSIEAFLCHCPGLKVVIPSNSRDAKRLLKTAIRDPNPVIFLEHKALYRQRTFCARKEPGKDELLPFGVANIVREGKDLTVIAYGMMVWMAYEVASRLEKEGISIEIVDLRTLVPLDFDAIRTSVQKTGRVVIVHEAAKNCGFGAEIAARIGEECFSYLDAPVKRVTGEDCPVPYAKSLEDSVLPQPEDLEKAFRELASF